MQLSKIKLAGFKSFVDPTTIHLPSNLVGIIGPNGCGKSNIIDAVRWVMGEISAKNLRGDSMADVIFNGSTGRKPVGHASIELAFDNSAGTLGGQYAAYSEISIRRQVSRDGTSSYFLNGTRCRRRDITDIFLGTGLGPRSYAIIEQGMISRLIEAKPDDLRVFFEEAAGISKYKERRRETETRIRHTRDNLDRLNDLIEEIEKQLDKLKRQARAAERYKGLKEEERQVKAELLALRYNSLHEDCLQKERQISEHKTALEARLAVQRSLEAELEKLRDSLAGANDAFNTVQGHYYKLGADVARIEQAIQHSKDSRQQQEEELARSEQTLKEIEEHIEIDCRRLEELAGDIDAIDPMLAAAREQTESSSAALKEAEQAMQSWREDWEKFNQRAAEQSQIAQVERTRIDHLERHMNQLEERLERMDQEQQSLDKQSLGSEIERLLNEATAQENAAADIHVSLDAVNLKIADIRSGIDQQEHEAAGLQDRHHELRGKLASLETLQQAALGQQSGAVGGWLESQGLGKASRLAQEITVEKGWEHAVETVLGSYLEAVCVDGFDEAEKMLSSFNAGSLVLFDTRAAATGTPAGVASGLLLEKVRSGLPVGSLLEGVLAADSLQQALDRHTQIAASESIITKDGIWIGRHWLRVARDTDEQAGVLERERNIATLRKELDEQAGSIDSLRIRISAGREALAAAEAEREQLQEEYNQVHRLASGLQARLSASKSRFEDQENRSRNVLEESETLRKQKDDEAAEFATARKRLQQALSDIELQGAERGQRTSEQLRLSAILEETRERARNDQHASHELALKSESLRTARETTGQGLERMREQSRQLVSRRDELTTILSRGNTPIADLEQELDEMLLRRSEVEGELSRARKKVEDIEHGARELDQQRVSEERAVSEQREQMERERMAWQEVKVRSDTVLEQINAADFDCNELLEGMEDEASVDAWEERAEKLDRSIQRLGPINLAAIEEYDEESKRKVYLDAQYADLQEALQTLENAIGKIDRETRTRFRETFDKVNEGLKKNFPRLFGGGHAYLELTGEDLLDTGVTVMARPPGKRNSTIHLLSGGEKALTAIALVFSIFELNPSPFCMLDEVDAPLDDANVGRYCEMVREMSERVQFIIITHNKITMELTNQLTGVTMSEPGVSRLVAVDIDAAVELAAV